MLALADAAVAGKGVDREGAAAQARPVAGTQGRARAWGGGLQTRRVGRSQGEWPCSARQGGASAAPLPRAPGGFCGLEGGIRSAASDARVTRGLLERRS